MRRTKKEMAALDPKIEELYRKGVGCRYIGKVLKEDPAIIYKRVKRMGLLRSFMESKPPLKAVPLPFCAHSQTDYARDAAVGTALCWFLVRGYAPSLPVVVVPYDLVVESDAGLLRVQVKTTSRKSCGRYVAQTCHKVYDGALQANAGGKRKPVPYTKDEIDIFFIVDAEGRKYLIPIEVVGSKTNIMLDEKYKEYLIE